MPVTVQCEQCGFRYAAPDALIGKRVRCKRCTAVFAVAAAPLEEGVGLSRADDDQPAGGAGPESALSEMDDIDAILRGGGAEAAISTDDIVRAAQPFDYPYSRQVERFLPLGLLLISGLLIISQTLALDDLGRGWLPAVRLLILLGLYAIVVFPITYVGVKYGVGKQGGHMPWSPAWKTFAIFSIAYALGYMLWLAGTNVASLLLGCLAGLAVALTALWLVFRMRLDKGPEPLIWGGAAFVFAVLLAGGFLAGLNLTTFAVTSGSQSAHTFAASPILPGLPWDAPQPPPEETDTPPRRPVTPPTVPEVELATPDSPDTTGAPDTPDIAGDPNASLQPDTSVASTDHPAIDAAPAPEHPAETPLAADPAPTVTDAGADPAPVTPPLIDPPAGSVDQPAPVPPRSDPSSQSTAVIEPSDLVDIAHPPVDADFERIVHPLVRGDAIAVVRSAGEEDIIERWQTADWTRTATARFRPDRNVGEQYAISPDGVRLARIVTWPTLSVQAWSFDDRRVSEIVELDADNGQPSLLGFTSPTQILVSWRKDGAYAVQWVDLQTRRRSGVVLDGVETLERNFALAPDGRTFAVAARLREGPSVVVYNVAGGRPVRSLPIRLLDARWGVQPTGLAFSADGTGLAAYFEQDGNGLLVTWAMPSGREAPPHVFPAGSIPPRRGTGGGQVFSYLAGGTLLLYGRDLVDSDSGRVIGSTGIQTAQSQRITANGILVVYADEQGQPRLAVATIRGETGGE